MTSGSAETSSSSKILQISSSWPALQCLEDFWGCPFLPWCYLRVMQRLPGRSSRMLMFETKQWWHGMLLHKGHPPEQWRALCWFVLAGGWYSPPSCSALLLNETRKKNQCFTPLCPFLQIKCFFWNVMGSLCFAAIHTLLCPSYLSCIHVAETSWTSAGKNLSGLLFYCTFLRLSQLIYFPGRNNAHKKRACTMNLMCSGCVRISAQATQVTKACVTSRIHCGCTGFTVHTQIVSTVHAKTG